MEIKNGIEILVGQMVFKLWIKTFKMLFGSITQESLGLLKFWCYFWVSLTIYYKMQTLFFKKVLIILRQSTKHANVVVGGAVPP